jgi:hypothetical protein
MVGTLKMFLLMYKELINIYLFALYNVLVIELWRLIHNNVPTLVMKAIHKSINLDSANYHAIHHSLIAHSSVFWHAQVPHHYRCLMELVLQHAKIISSTNHLNAKQIVIKAEYLSQVYVNRDVLLEWFFSQIIHVVYIVIRIW